MDQGFAFPMRTNCSFSTGILCSFQPVELCNFQPVLIPVLINAGNKGSDRCSFSVYVISPEMWHQFTLGSGRSLVQAGSMSMVITMRVFGKYECKKSVNRNAGFSFVKFLF